MMLGVPGAARTRVAWGGAVAGMELVEGVSCQEEEHKAAPKSQSSPVSLEQIASWQGL